MIKWLFSIMALLFSSITCAQTPIIIPVWPNGAAENNGITQPEEIVDGGRLLNSQVAEILVYLPEKSLNTRTAVLICPGGGYARQAIQHEGHDFAKILNQKGVAGIVLKYRLPNGHKNIPLSDARQAMKIIRSKAPEWNIDPNKIGISGFSAGGHLASTLGTHFNDQDRPDFMILFYPVITMNNNFTHKGSKENLLGKGIEDDNFSNEKQIQKDAPPTLLFLSDDDKSVPPANSTLFYNGLKEKGVKGRLSIQRPAVFLRWVFGCSPPNRTYTSPRIRLSTNNISLFFIVTKFLLTLATYCDCFPFTCYHLFFYWAVAF